MLTDERLEKLSRIEGSWTAEKGEQAWPVMVCDADGDEVATVMCNLAIPEYAEDRAELMALAPELVEEVIRLRAALADIVRWADAYPLTIFPEPDMALAHKLLKAGGVSLDAVSASCMRYVAEQVKATVTKALGRKPACLPESQAGRQVE